MNDIDTQQPLHEAREVTLADGSTLSLMTWVYDRGTHVDRYDDILLRTRTGKFIHKGSPGSSVTNCGRWLRTNGSYFAVDPARVHRTQLCAHCFPSSNNR